MIQTKQAIYDATGEEDTLALAIAMLESDRLSSDYPFGDVYPVEHPSPSGTLIPKTGDAANFGIYKMNWFMIRQLPAGKEEIRRAAGGEGGEVLPDGEIQNIVGARINADAGLATRILLEAFATSSLEAPDPAHPEPGNFWGGHRWGESGWTNVPGTDWHDVRRYYDAVRLIQAACDDDPAIWTSDIRYGVVVPNV
jgi:hypothetical protein